jgi:hypothetical protein
MGTGGATALLSPECDAGLAVRRLRGDDKSMPTSGDWRLTQTLYNLISKEHDLQSAIRNLFWLSDIYIQVFGFGGHKPPLQHNFV